MNSLAKALTLAGRLARITFTNPGRLGHVLGSALAASGEVADRSTDLLRLPRVMPEDLLPEKMSDARATLALFPKVGCSVSVMEYVCLILLLKRARANSVFEFGTYKGLSITQLALNVPPGGTIRTLDLPEDDPRLALNVSDPDEKRIASETGKGVLVPEDLRRRIEFLKADSARFDPAPYEGSVDFVFVDGAHSADYVKNDSEKGWRMLRPGGIIAWHDFRTEDADVVRYLLACPYRPAWVAGTSLAFAVKD